MDYDYRQILTRNQNSSSKYSSKMHHSQKSDDDENQNSPINNSPLISDNYVDVNQEEDDSSVQEEDEENDPADKDVDPQVKKDVDEFVYNHHNSFNFSHAMVRYAGRRQDENFVIRRTEIYPAKIDHRPKDFEDCKFCLKIFFNYEDVQHGVNNHQRARPTNDDEEESESTPLCRTKHGKIPVKYSDP